MNSFIIRRIDDLGRIVLPKEWRDFNEIDKRAPLEIHMEGDAVTVRKYVDSCVFCGAKENLQEYNGKRICGECLKSLIISNVSKGMN